MCVRCLYVYIYILNNASNHNSNLNNGNPFSTVHSIFYKPHNKSWPEKTVTLHLHILRRMR